MKKSSLILYHQLLADPTEFCESHEEVLLLDTKQICDSSSATAAQPHYC